MGLLRRWDEHNQRTLEWHNDVAEEQRTRDPNLGLGSWKVVAAIWLGVGVAHLGLEELVGPSWTLAVMGVVAVAAFVAFVVQVRSRRRAWEAGRYGRRPHGAAG